MSHPNLAHRLPYEVICQIIEAPVLGTSDLTNSCLVSRKLLEPAQKRLYETATVLIIEEVPRPAHSPHRLYRYHPRTWKLIRTLSEKPRLAKFVKRLMLELGNKLSLEETQDTGLEVRPAFALSTFLQIAENVVEVSFPFTWNRNLEEELEVIKDYKKVETLSMGVATHENVEYIAHNIPHLKHLTLAELDETGFDPDNFSSPNKLELLATSTDSPAMIAILSANLSTLRHLSIPIEALLDFDFSQIPHLESLRLGSNRTRMEELEPDEEFEFGEKCNEFWTSLCRSSSLETLAFEAGRCLERVETALFEPSCYNMFHSDKPAPQQSIPTLTTLRFYRDIELDRANFFLSVPLGSTLRRIVIPGRLGSPKATLEESNKLDFVAGICKKRGIELVWGD
ncbi:hypothetical protein JCM5350_001363 [Sporobolomyces pararoseus]